MDKRNFEYRFPANWFQGFLLAILPGKMKELVVYKTISFVVVYPNFKPDENYKVYTKDEE
jgi:hypothetical protein